MSTQKYLIVVGGPTASGKTGFAIRLAQYFHTEILSVDSRQFYREMQIGTAKPTNKELAAAPHHFVGHLSINDTYSVGDFEKEALDRLSELFERHSIVIASGGSGLYIKALCEGLDAFPNVPSGIRQAVEDLYQKSGLEGLQTTLQELDPDYYKVVDLQNPHRLIRAISVCQASGSPFSSFLAQKNKPRDFTPIYLQLHWPRAQQYDRINRRVDLMMQEGQLAEAQRLLEQRDLTALQTVGYQELFDHLQAKQSLSESVELIKRNTRRYAKRQLTWMRRDGFWKHFHPSEWELTLSYLELVMEQDFRIRTATESERLALLDLGSKEGVSYADPDSLVFLIGTIAQAITQAIPLVFSKKEVLQLPQIGKQNGETTATSLLQHEVQQRAEDRPLFHISPVPPTLWQGVSPQPIVSTTLAQRVQKWIPPGHQVWQFPNS